MRRGIAGCGVVVGERRAGGNLDDGGGLRKRLETSSRKRRLAPPWEKGQTMDIWSKDYAESYQDTMQQDWVSDLWNLWYPLRNEIITAFQTGDAPVEDVQAALKQFGSALIAYVQQGITLDMTEYLQPDGDDNSPKPMYMSADDNPETKDAKAGRVISAANHAKITAAVKGISGHADGIDEHIMQIKKILSSPSSAPGQNTLSGYQVYSGNEPSQQKEEDDDPTPEQKEEPFVDIHTMLHDLAMTLAADNANRGM